MAMLAMGGANRLKQIAQRAAALSPAARTRVFVQLTLLAGLRGLSERLRMEVKAMGSQRAPFRDNVILREFFDEERAEGKAEGKAAGMAELLRGQMEIKFGLIPKWAEVRLNEANTAQILRWSKKLLDAQRLEDVIRRK